MREVQKLIIGVIAGFVLGIILINMISRLDSPQKISNLIGDQDSWTKIQIDAFAPDFILESISGEWIQLSELRGKVVIIIFWATWCGPCRVEMPAFQSRYESFSKELVVLAINEQDTLEDIREFMEELGLSFYALIDVDGSAHRDYVVRGFPTTFLVDAEGILQIQHIGVMTENQLDDYLAEVGL